MLLTTAFIFLLIVSFAAGYVYGESTAFDESEQQHLADIKKLQEAIYAMAEEQEPGRKLTRVK